MRVLIADDNEITLELLRNALTEWGYEVDLAGDGEQAWSLLRRRAHRIVLCDWEMPHLTGVELCRKIRERRFAEYVYVILLTARSGKSDLVEGMEAGADDFISKPFHPAELKVRLRAGERVLSLQGRDLTILALAKLADSRDPETGAHLERMREYSRALAKQLSRTGRYRDLVDADYIEAIYATSVLHDIGKVGIPDYVLLKPGRLTDQEYEIMKRHTLIGAETLEAVGSNQPEQRFLQMARDIALTHHERYDGNGYPHGLVGEQIPLCGRIIALADAYDALTSRRVYKAAMSHDLAREIIVKESGSHFDPDIVAAFLQCEATFVMIHQGFAQQEEAGARTFGLATVVFPEESEQPEPTLIDTDWPDAAAEPLPVGCETA